MKTAKEAYKEIKKKEKREKVMFLSLAEEGEVKRRLSVLIEKAIANNRYYFLIKIVPSRLLIEYDATHSNLFADIYQYVAYRKYIIEILIKNGYKVLQLIEDTNVIYMKVEITIK